MLECKGYATKGFKDKLAPFSFNRRDVGPSDVLIDILYCGVCHSDIHQARNEWGRSIYPMVPGHEIVGKVVNVGNKVTKFKTGDVAGVGCFVDSCRDCLSCSENLEQYCENGFVATYNGCEKSGQTITYGGYSNKIVVDEKFGLQIAANLDLAAVAPLLCAGITTYSPLRHWNAGPGKKVGVIGLGGLGHMALKLANSFGAEVALFTTSENKRDDALRLGAHKIIISSNSSEMTDQFDSLDLIINTVSANIDLNVYVKCLKRDGTLVLLGVPEKSTELEVMNLIFKRRNIAGSLIGGLQETQAMLDYCAEHNITSNVEIIPIEKINEAYNRVIDRDVKYRFVIDMGSL
jgi:alcohol dehydrogenase (NADP+)